MFISITSCRLITLSLCILYSLRVIDNVYTVFPVASQAVADPGSPRGHDPPKALKGNLGALKGEESPKSHKDKGVMSAVKHTGTLKTSLMRGYGRTSNFGLQILPIAIESELCDRSVEGSR